MKPSISGNDRMVPIVTSSYYQGWMRGVRSLFRLTRSSYVITTPEMLLQMQDGIVHWMAQLVLVNQQGKQDVSDARNRGDVAESEAVKVQRQRHRHIMRVLHMIADGLAFRLLGFDRPFLRLMVNPPKPYFSVNFSEAYPGMRAAAVQLMNENGSRILFNDITHVLRVGDLTEILPDGRIMVHEIKKGGAKVKNIRTEMGKILDSSNSRLSKQLRNVVTAQIARDLRKIHTESDTIQIEDVGVCFQNNLDEVGLLIRRARKSVVATAHFGDYLTVHCICFDAVKRNREQKLDSVELPDWDASDVVYQFGNRDLFFSERSDYARNMTPYSIFPCRTQECLDLM